MHQFKKSHLLDSKARFLLDVLEGCEKSLLDACGEDSNEEQFFWAQTSRAAQLMLECQLEYELNQGREEPC